MALELQQGYAVLYMDYGSGTVKLDQPHIKLTDGERHRIDVYFTKNVSAIGLYHRRIIAFYLFPITLYIVSYGVALVFTIIFVRNTSWSFEPYACTCINIFHRYLGYKYEYRTSIAIY